MHIVLRNHLFQRQTIELDADTRELVFPGHLRIEQGGYLPTHVHQYDRPWECVAVFVRPQECPRCPK